MRFAISTLAVAAQLLATATAATISYPTTTSRAVSSTIKPATSTSTVKITSSVSPVKSTSTTAAPAASVSPVTLQKSSCPGGTINYETPCFSFDTLYNLHKRFYDNFIFPNNLAQQRAINSSLIAPNCLGRVDLSRDFVGQELNTEYLFGLFGQIANNNSISLLGVPYDYNITHFTANQNIASGATIVMFNVVSLGIKLPVEILTTISFNADGQINQYDATFRLYNWGLDYVVQQAMPLINATTPQQAQTFFTNALASGICNTHAQYCTGSNAQYQSTNDCLAYLTTQVRFGAAYELGRNTLLCRTVHQNMIPFRPETHCPHISPSGGGMCVDDMTYPQKVLEQYFKNAPMVPFGYQNKDAGVASL